MELDIRDLVAVLDDDPTGGQTIAGVEEILDLTPEAVRAAVDRTPPGGTVLFLTNTRTLPPEEAGRQVTAAARRILRAARSSGRRVLWVQRADSTLRGHFPLEVERLARVLGQEEGSGPAVILLVPAFPEAGRVTVDGVHYLIGSEGDLIPVHTSEYARDPLAPYRTSWLPGWVEEKTGGRVPSSAVLRIGLRQLREEGPARVAGMLACAPFGAYAVADAQDERDLEVLAEAVRRYFAAGGRPLVRCAASFLKALGRFPRTPLLRLADLARPGQGGLVVAGSFVANTTRQLERLAERLPDLARFELPWPLADVSPLAREVSRELARGRTVVVATPRAFVGGPEEAYAVGRTLADQLAAAVRALEVVPRWLILKGGNTAYHVVRQGLGAARAWVVGQVLPGVPVWRVEVPGWSEVPVVVFPGNVGSPNALADVAAGAEGRSLS